MHSVQMTVEKVLKCLTDLTKYINNENLTNRTKLAECINNYFTNVVSMNSNRSRQLTHEALVSPMLLVKVTFTLGETETDVDDVDDFLLYTYNS